MTKETKIGVVAQSVGDFKMYIEQIYNKMENGSAMVVPSLNPKIITTETPNGEKTKYFLIQSFDDTLGLELDGSFICENISDNGAWFNMYERTKQIIR